MAWVSREVEDEYVPSAVFARPEAATVGMTEAKAREKFGDVQCYRTEFQPLFYSMTQQNEQAMMKLVVDGIHPSTGEEFLSLE